MKKLIALAMAAAMTVSMSACGAKPAPSEVVPMQMANPWREADEAEVMETLGITMYAPAGAEAVSYRIMETDTETMANMDFTLDGIAYYLRAEAATAPEAYDMSGLEYPWDYEESEPVGYCDGTLRLCSEAGSIFWQDAEPGINYTLGAAQAVSIPDMAGTAEQCFIFTSAEPFVMRWGIPNFTGVYTTEKDGNAFIDLMDDNVYVTNFWLNNNQLSLSGNGTILDNTALEMLLETDDGKQVTAVFYMKDDLYVMTITGSEVDELPQNTDIEFFFDEEATASMYGDIETPELQGVLERTEQFDDAREFLVFNPDGTGWYSVQDDIPMQWDESCITLESGEVYDYAVTWEDMEHYTVLLFLEQGQDGSWIGTEFHPITEYPDHIAALLP